MGKKYKGKHRVHEDADSDGLVAADRLSNNPDGGPSRHPIKAMEQPFAQLIRSPIFKFRVRSPQEDAVSFSVHGAVIAALSNPLSAMMGDDWKEGVDKEVYLSGTSEETFIRICQYAYTGNYDAAEPRIEALPADEAQHSPSTRALVSQPLTTDPNVFPHFVMDHPDNGDAKTPQDANPGLVGSYGWTMPRTSYNSPFTQRNPQPKPVLRAKFDDYKLPELLSLPTYSIRENSNAGEDYSPVFLSHAQVYLFASQWQVKSLRALSLNMLYNVLKSFTLYSERVKDVVALVRFAYLGDENTDDLPTAEGDDLRKVISLYVASNAKLMHECEEFKELIREGGDFVADFVALQVQSLS